MNGISGFNRMVSPIDKIPMYRCHTNLPESIDVATSLSFKQYLMQESLKILKLQPSVNSVL